jgi:hypothetical protein
MEFPLLTPTLSPANFLVYSSLRSTFPRHETLTARARLARSTHPTR